MYLKMRGLSETDLRQPLSSWIDDPCAGVCTFHNAVNQLKGDEHS